MIVVSLAGLKRCGKTTVAEALIREFKRRGLKVGGIKVMHHSSLSIDVDAKDTWRHKEAGADFVLSLSKNELGYVERSEEPPTLSDAARIIPEDTDILICEGPVEPGKNVLTIVLSQRLDLLPETFRVRGPMENVIALSGVMANETKEHPELPVFNCIDDDETSKLAELILKKGKELGGKGN